MVKLINRASGVVKEKKYFPFGIMLLLLVISFFAVFQCAGRLISTYNCAIDMVVQDNYQICEQPLNNRCVTHYRVTNSRELESDFVPFGYQFEQGLLKSNPHIEKKAYGFTYRIDGESQQWPYLWQHVGVMLIGVIGLGICVGLLRSRSFYFGWRRKRSE